ncbi:MAG TPA: hypothetical protein VHP30_06685 [Ignavibacteriales bacterium]|nr:hypothetical protein [Ignavibacteriales bacterium]
MDNTINLQLNFDGQEANAAIKLTNDNIKELYNSFIIDKLAEGVL